MEFAVNPKCQNGIQNMDISKKKKRKQTTRLKNSIKNLNTIKQNIY